MPGIKDLSLKEKLIAIQLATACTALLFYASISFIHDLKASRNSVFGQLSSAAHLVGGSAASALDFGDHAAAEKILATLEDEPAIVNACLYDAQGGVFAKYTRNGYPDFLPPAPAGETRDFGGGFASLSHGITRGGDALGTILLRSDTKQYQRAVEQSALGVFSLLIVGIAVATLLALLAQKAISGPILSLAAAAKRISETGEYSFRVEERATDEIGALGRSFNEMLAQVEERDAELRETHAALETRVKERTAELEQKSAELSAATEHLGAILEGVSSGIVLAKDRVIVRANRRLDEMFGYGPGEMLGKGTRIWYLSDEDYRSVGEGIADSTGQGDIYSRELQLVRKDGRRFWCRILVQSVDKLHPGPASGVVGVFDDTTAERENAEALNRALEAAKAADRLKSAFLATMSHELRTPLNSIIGFTGILRQELPGPLNEEQKKQLGMVGDSAEHLLELINDVLDISKIEAGQLQVASESFDLRAAVHKAVLTARPLADKKGVALEEEIAPEVGAITADRRRVEQVLLNLLSNAIKFTDRGSVRAECALRGGQVFISVRDSGIGIRKEHMDDLFRPFRQIDTGISRQYEGTGLGLSICKRLLELMGGSIKAESEWGKGSTFSVTLPAERKLK